MKNLILAFFIFLSVPFVSNAQVSDYSRNPAGNGTYDQITFNFVVDDIAGLCGVYSDYGITLAYGGSSSFLYSGNIGSGNGLASYRWVFDEVGDNQIEQILVDCYDGNTLVSAGAYSLEYTGGTLFTTKNYTGMSASAGQTLITDGLSTFGLSVLGILAIVIVMMVAYLVFTMGWRAIKNSVMGSQGMAFNLHGESSGHNTFKDLDSFSDEAWDDIYKFKGYGNSDEQLEKDYETFSKKHGRMNRTSFEESYFNV